MAVLRPLLARDVPFVEGLEHAWAARDGLPWIGADVARGRFDIERWLSQVVTDPMIIMSTASLRAAGYVAAVNLDARRMYGELVVVGEPHNAEPQMRGVALAGALRFIDYLVISRNLRTVGLRPSRHSQSAIDFLDRLGCGRRDPQDNFYVSSKQWRDVADIIVRPAKMNHLKRAELLSSILGKNVVSE